jgi:tetratricopeptide (TPR) repeat protein
MKESYPYFVVPQKVEKIKSEGIPLPPLPQLLPLPEPVKRKYIGTVIFVVSLIAFVILARHTIFYTFIFFFIALISLVAAIFEFVQFGKLKKQYILDMKLYNENKEAFKKIKANQEKIAQNNKDENLIKKYQLDKIKEFFGNSFDTINAIMNEYSLAKKRYKLFLEEYFPNEVLDNVRIIHSAKNLEYVPDFVIKFEKPKLNVAIEIEEPYSLSNVPENIQKDYDAKDRIRQRFANELGWIVVVISEEQAIKYPIECCKFIEDSIEYIFTDVKGGKQFVNIQPIQKQKMLTGEERAHLKTSGYREKYLIEAGLMDDDETKNGKQNGAKTENEKVEISNYIKEHNNKVKSDEVIVPETILPVDDMKTPDDKKESIENEQLMLIKKVAQKVKPENGEIKEKEIQKEPLVIKTESPEIENAQIIKTVLATEKKIEKADDEIVEENNTLVEKEKLTETLDSVKIEEKSTINHEIVIENNTLIEEKAPIKEEKVVENNSIINEIDDLDNTSTELTQKGDLLRKEDDILKDLYNALDKHSKKQQDRKEKRIRERHVTHDDLIVDTEDDDLQEQINLESVSTKNEPFITDNESIISENTNIVQSTEKSIEEKIAEETIVNEVKQEDKIQSSNLESVITEKQEKEVENIENELNQEDLKSNKFIDETSNVQILNIEAQKNQALIEEYREKIEGAVFDKKWDELVSICTEAISILPFWDWAYYRRSTAWGNKRDFDKVIEDCSKAVSYNPTLADAYYNRGTARFFTNRFREAIEDYQKAIDLNYIKKADAYFNKGLCYQKLDYHKKGYLEFMKAKELGSKKAEEVLRTQYD